MSLSNYKNEIKPLGYEAQVSILCEVCGTLLNYNSSYHCPYQISHLELSQFECKHCDRTFQDWIIFVDI